MKNEIIQVFLDVDMRAGHRGLADVAKKRKVDVLNLDPGEHVVFVNRKVDKIKIYSARNVLSYLLSDKQLDISALSYFSDCYGAKGFNYDNALRKVLLQKLSAGVGANKRRGGMQAELSAAV